jgi:type II secretory pathway predicted ATPase ExeA
MYESFYGLSERPFAPSPDPRFLLLTRLCREALAQIEYGITERYPMTLLTGLPGTGKTTLLRAGVDRCIAADHLVVWISNPALSRAEWYEWLAAGFGLSERAACSKARFLLELSDLLHERLAGGRGAALVVDEAQALSAELLEELRLLANLETPTTKLLPIVLAATPELEERLRLPQHSALKQRVSLRSVLAPLDLDETAAYIEGRLRIAGGSGGRVFTADAVRAVRERSGGVPRLISLIAEHALISGFACRQRPIEASVVHEVGTDLDLGPSVSLARPSAEAAAPGSVGDPGERPLAPARSTLFGTIGDERSAAVDEEDDARRESALYRRKPVATGLSALWRRVTG